MSRADEPGWMPVGPLASRRRGLWFRRTASALEICSGQDGESAIVKLLEGEPIRPALLEQLRDVLEVYHWGHAIKPAVDVLEVIDRVLDQEPEKA